MFLSLLLPSVLALYTLYKKKLSISAIILAWLLGFVICYFGDYYAFAALCVTFILTILSDKVKKNKGERRNIYQIVCNVLIPAISIILYKLSGNSDFYIIYYCVIGGSLADTLASSIGLLSKGRNFNPLTLIKMKKGTSGAVSMLGFFSSFMGGVIIGLIYFIKVHNIKILVLISLMAFLGSYLDSVFGVLIQGLYKCKVCKKECEEKIHCNKKTTLIKGFSFVNNNVVNFLNNLCIFIISFIIL